MFRALVALVAVLALPALTVAQAPVQLKSVAASGTIAANGESVTLNNVGGLASVTVQTLDTYSGTLELQCATDAAQTSFDADDEVMLSLMGATTTSTDIVDTVGIYQGNISGCTAVKLIATAGFAASDTAVRIVAITPGGGSSGGGASGSVSIAQGGNTAAVNASSQLSVTCANCSGSGVSQLEDTAFVDGGATTPAGVQRQDTLASSTSLDGDVSVIKSDSVGRIYTTGTGGTFPVLLPHAIGSTTSGQIGAIIMGAVTTGAPTYTTAQTHPISLTTNGDIRVSNTTGVSISSIVPGVGATNLAKLEDNPAASGDVGMMVLGQIQATLGASAADGDYGTVKLNPEGATWTEPTSTAVLGTATYTEATSKGLVIGAVRRDADTTLASATNEVAPLQVNAGGQLKVACIAGCSGSTFADNAAFTFGTTVISPIGGVFDDTSSNTATENSAAVARITANKALHVNLRTAAGVELTPATDATLGTSTYTEATTTGPVVAAVRNDTPDALVNTTNEATPLGTNAAGALWTSTIDPCTSLAKIYIPISIATGTQLFTGTASNRTYVCQLSLVSATAQNIALVSGTGTVCATSLGPMMGGTTAATGFNFAANGGIVIGNGAATIAKSDTDADNICILMSSTGQLSGVLSYVVAPN